MIDSYGLRIGDAERQEAAELLGEHLAAGRIDYDEFEQRVGAVLAARTRAELISPFDDLPGPRPAMTGEFPMPYAAPRVPAGAPGQDAATATGVWPVPAAATLVAGFMVLLVLGWWLSFAPAFLPLLFITVTRFPRHGGRNARFSAPRG